MSAYKYAVEIPYQEVYADEALKLWRNEDALVVDVRQPEQYQRERIKGSLLIPVLHLKARVAELPRDKKLLFICEDGSKSMLACELLTDAGFSSQNLFNILEGFQACKRAGFPLE